MVSLLQTLLLLIENDLISQNICQIKWYVFDGQSCMHDDVTNETTIPEVCIHRLHYFSHFQYISVAKLSLNSTQLNLNSN